MKQRKRKEEEEWKQRKKEEKRLEAAKANSLPFGTPQVGLDVAIIQL